LRIISSGNTGRSTLLLCSGFVRNIDKVVITPLFDMIIDAHAHVSRTEYYTDPIYGKTVKAHTVDDQLRAMDEYGIDNAVVVNSWAEGEVALSPEAVKESNEFATTVLAKKYPRLIPWALVNYCLPDAVQTLKEAIKAGCRGAKIFPLPFIPIDSEQVRPVFETANSLRIPVTIHSDSNLWYTSPWRIARIAESFPELLILVAHIGVDHDKSFGFLESKNLQELNNLFVELSATAMTPYLVSRACELLGARRVVYGTDSHSFPPILGIMKVRLADLSKEETDLILGGNMARLLELHEHE